MNNIGRYPRRFQPVLLDEAVREPLDWYNSPWGRNGLRAALREDGKVLSDVDERRVIYRVLQEALNNVRPAFGASDAWIW